MAAPKAVAVAGCVDGDPEELSAQDKAAILRHTMAARGRGLHEPEKSYVVEELRKGKKRDNFILNNVWMKAVVKKGLAEKRLVQTMGGEDKVLEQVRQFLKTFTLMVNAQGVDVD